MTVGSPTIVSLELILRGLAAFQFALLFGLFARVRRPDHLPLTGMLLCASLVAFIVSSVAGADEWLGLARWPVTALCVLKPVLLWMFARAIFADRFAIGGQDVAALLAMGAAGLGHEVLDDTGGTGWAPMAAMLLRDGLALTFVLAVPLTLWRDRRTDLDERRRRIRQRVLPIAAGYLALVIGWQLAAFAAGLPRSPVLVSANLAVMWLGGLAVFLSLIRVDVVDWLRQATLTSPDALNANERAVLARLRRHMATPRWYADSQLSIARLARALATNEQSLRNVINAGLGYRNFNEFLHRFRLQEAAALLADPTEERRTVLSIALEAGFGSIGPFNRAFRAKYGVTPTGFRREALRSHRAQATS